MKNRLERRENPAPLHLFVRMELERLREEILSVQTRIRDILTDHIHETDDDPELAGLRADIEALEEHDRLCAIDSTQDPRIRQLKTEITLVAGQHPDIRGRLERLFSRRGVLRRRVNVLKAQQDTFPRN